MFWGRESRVDKSEGKAFNTHLVSEQLKSVVESFRDNPLFHNDQNNSTTSHEMSCSKTDISGYFSYYKLSRWY